ncbi:MAG: glycosyltransferase family 39 protein [Planctomycetes bacterium]|nr:glycosyltransferase family 39 protein [Planctomycetota bacterium]
MTTRERAGLIGVLAAAFVLRVLLVLSLRGQPYFDTPIVDSAAYDQCAVEISTKSFWGDKAFYQDPLYPYCLGIFYKIFGRDLLWVRLVQAAIGTAGLWMLFEAARRFLGYRTAIVALAIGALYKAFLFYDTALLKEFLGAVAIEAALLAWSLDKKWKGLAFGAALGIGTLVRGNLLLLAVAASALLALRRDWKAAGLVVAGAVLCILPATIRNAVVAKDFVLTTSQFGPNLYTGNNPENTTGRYRPPSFLKAGAPEFEEAGFRAEAERIEGRPMKASEIDAFWRRHALSYIGSNMGTFLVVTAKRLLMLTNNFEIPDNYNLPFMARFSWVLQAPLFTFGWFVAPLAAAWLYLSWPERGKFAMLYVLLGAYVASISFFFVFGRYRLPVIPILILFAAHAIVKTIQLRAWRMSALPKAAAGVFVAALIFVNAPLPASVGGYRDFRTAHYNLALYYRSHDQPAEAAREFESAARLNPDMLKDPSFVWALGESYEKSGQAPKALEKYREAVRIDRQSAEAPYRVGRLYFDEGMYDRSAEMFAETLRRDPKFTAAAEPLAESYRRLRRFDAALEALEGPAREAPRDWAIRVKRAEIYQELSMWKEMLKASEEALALRPGQPDALRLRDEAKKKLKWPF